MTEGLGSATIEATSTAGPVKTAVTNSGSALNHPFYLNTVENNQKEEIEPNNRFGTIQLLGSDGEDSDEQNTKKRKKKRDKRRKKKSASDDLDIFNGGGN